MFEILKKIKAERINRGYNQADMANKLDISTATYSRFERGITSTNYEMLIKISSILDLKLGISEEQQIEQNYLNEKSVNYPSDSSEAQINTLINLLEQQQQTNHLIIQKLRTLKLNTNYKSKNNPS